MFVCLATDTGISLCLSVNYYGRLVLLCMGYTRLCILQIDFFQLVLVPIMHEILATER